MSETARGRLCQGSHVSLASLCLWHSACLFQERLVPLSTATDSECVSVRHTQIMVEECSSWILEGLGYGSGQDGTNIGS